jgi:hypothetical protein
MSTDAELIKLAARHKLGIYFCSKSKRNGLAYIRILRDKSVLAEFHDLADAFAWFPKSPLPVAAGNSIPTSTANA